jgi:hypothetical protein
VITLIGTGSITLEVWTSYVDAGATANDDQDGNITANIVTVNPVNTWLVWTYTITYNVSDSTLNSAVQVIRTVNIVDTTIPVVTLNGTTPITIEVWTSYVDAGAL